jgi:ubiquitin C-terminal hydrolase
VDLFHGLLRSQVKCRVCQLKSVRFDPFNILSLPLPIDSSIYIDVKRMSKKMNNKISIIFLFFFSYPS